MVASWPFLIVAFIFIFGLLGWVIYLQTQINKTTTEPTPSVVVTSTPTSLLIENPQTVVDVVNGDDVTGLFNRSDLPLKTIEKAVELVNQESANATWSGTASIIFRDTANEYLATTAENWLLDFTGGVGQKAKILPEAANAAPVQGTVQSVLDFVSATSGTVIVTFTTTVVTNSLRFLTFENIEYPVWFASSTELLVRTIPNLMAGSTVDLFTRKNTLKGSGGGSITVGVVSDAGTVEVSNFVLDGTSSGFTVGQPSDIGVSRSVAVILTDCVQQFQIIYDIPSRLTNFSCESGTMIIQNDMEIVRGTINATLQLVAIDFSLEDCIGQRIISDHSNVETLNTSFRPFSSPCFTFFLNSTAMLNGVTAVEIPTGNVICNADNGSIVQIQDFQIMNASTTEILNVDNTSEVDITSMGGTFFDPTVLCVVENFSTLRCFEVNNTTNITGTSTVGGTGVVPTYSGIPSIVETLGSILYTAS